MPCHQVFPTAVIHLDNGRSITITITAPHAAPDAPYVHGLTVNGVVHNQPWLTFGQLAHGASLDYDLATTPDTTWGAAASAAPPSDGYGERTQTTASPHDRDPSVLGTAGSPVR
jgi:putative alpha-1,2-mannosidase